MTRRLLSYRMAVRASESAPGQSKADCAAVNNIAERARMWAVGRTHAGSEQKTCDALREFSDLTIDCYFPKIATMTRPSKRRGVVVSLRPAFPGYVFMKGLVADLCNTIDRMPEKRQPRLFRRSNDELAFVGDDEIGLIVEQEKAWCKSPMKNASRFCAGQKVIMSDGPFIGHSGIILNVRAHDVEVSLQMRGKLGFKVTAPVRYLAAVI